MTPLRITAMNYKENEAMTPIDQWPPQRTPVLRKGERDALSQADIDMVNAAIDRCLQRCRSTVKELDNVLLVLRGAKK
jgi:hypothetical protein